MKSPSAPKEDPQAKADRLRERRLTELDRTAAAQDQAAALTSDLRAVYGLKGLKNMGAFRPVSGSSGPIAPPTPAVGTASFYQAMKSNPVLAMKVPSYQRPLALQNGQNR